MILPKVHVLHQIFFLVQTPIEEMEMKTACLYCGEQTHVGECYETLKSAKATNTPWGDWNTIAAAVRPTPKELERLTQVEEKFKTAFLKIIPKAKIVKNGLHSYGRKTFLKGSKTIKLEVHIPEYSAVTPGSTKLDLLQELLNTFQDAGSETVWVHALLLREGDINIHVCLHGDVCEPNYLRESQRTLLFFEGQDEMYQDLVRVARYYWKQNIKPNGLRRSQMLELIMLHSYQFLWTETFESQEERCIATFCHFLDSLCKYKSMWICWNAFYALEVAQTGFYNTTCPVVVDPSCPEINLAEGDNWELISLQAQKTLQEFQNLKPPPTDSKVVEPMKSDMVSSGNPFILAYGWIKNLWSGLPD